MNSQNIQTTNDTELGAYIHLCGQAAELLAQLTEWVDNHGDVAPDDISQIHVNRMNTIVDRLESLNRYTEII